MRIDACAELGVPGLDVKKSFRAYIELDPCNYVIKAAFEKWNVQIILFEYDWGMNVKRILHTYKLCGQQPFLH